MSYTSREQQDIARLERSVRALTERVELIEQTRVVAIPSGISLTHDSGTTVVVRWPPGEVLQMGAAFEKLRERLSADSKRRAL